MISEIVVRINDRTLLVSCKSLVEVTELLVDVTLYIIKRYILRLVLLRLSKKFEESVCVASALEVVVDETDKDALALRELCKALLKSSYTVLLVTKVEVNITELSEDLTVLIVVLSIEASLEISLCCLIILHCPINETCIVERCGIDLRQRSSLGCISSLADEDGSSLVVSKRILVHTIHEILLRNILDTCLDVSFLRLLCINLVCLCICCERRSESILIYRLGNLDDSYNIRSIEIKVLV